MNPPYTKKMRAQLRELVGLVYKRRLEAALHELDQHFSEWKAGKTDAFSLEHKIHLFHKGPSRELYNHFADGPKSLHATLVAHALIDGILKQSDIPPLVREAISEKVELLRKWDEE